MFRRIILTAALASFVVTSAWAQTRATYVLSNGEKHNGVIVYGRGDNNLVDDKYHVNKSGVELVFGRPDVAVIDFVGGTPSASERQALPSDNVGLMVMRDGSMHRGTLHDIRKGDVVQWVNEAGQRNDFPIATVRRLYLYPEAAKTAFFNNVVGTSGTSSGAVSQTRQGGIFGRPATAVRVDGNQQWVDTGLDVRRGDRLTVNATGQVEFAPGNRVTPAGSRGTNANYPVPAMGGGGLIAKVGDGAPFAVGAGSRTMTMPEDGRFFLGVNDENVSDNSGAFSVTVRRQ